MATESKVEYCHHSHSPWFGCTKKSPGCLQCFAERWGIKFGRAKWGAGQPRILPAPKTREKPRYWNRAAQLAGERRRVLCGELCDVFDAEAAYLWKLELFNLIRECPHLDFIIPTKRIEEAIVFFKTSGIQIPPNVWLGVSVENQECANQRIPLLLTLRQQVSVLFVSAEPLLEEIDISPWIKDLDWVIVGGESGTDAREFQPAWALSLIRQCSIPEVPVPIFVKQMGTVWARSQRVIAGIWEHTGEDAVAASEGAGDEEGPAGMARGASPRYWPNALKLQQYPSPKISPPAGEQTSMF